VKNYIYAFFIILVVACSKSAPADIIPPITDTLSSTSPDTVQHIGAATIVIMGSSTAAGMGAVPADSSWVNRLKLATAENKKKLTWYNLANGGYTTYQALPVGSGVTDTLRNITRALQLRPSLVMISYPTNDVADNYTDAEIMGNYKELVRVIDSANVPYILFGTQPRNFKDMAQRLRLKALNEEMRMVYGDRFNNVYDTLAAADLTIRSALSFGDGVHVNNTGHRIIMQTVLQHAVFKKVIAD
jgi:lysophospholipase L1-like esterase